MSLLLRKATIATDPGRGPNDRTAKTGANTAEPALARGVHDSLLWMAQQLTDEYLGTHSAADILRALPWSDFSYRLYDATHVPLEHVVRTAAEKETLKISRGPMRKAVLTDATDQAVVASMTVIDPFAVAYAEQASGKLIVQISDTLRTVLGEAVLSSVTGQISSYQLARVIRAVIPLHSAWAAATQKTYARTLTEQLTNGASITTAQQQATAAMERHAKALTVARSWNIARTETMTAANQGKFASWQDGVGKGWLVADSLKIWDEGRDPCDRCAPLVGEIRRWDEPFSNGQMMPPDHNSCRCDANLVPPDENYLEEMARQRASELGVPADVQPAIDPSTLDENDARRLTYLTEREWQYRTDPNVRADAMWSYSYQGLEVVRQATRNVQAGQDALAGIDIPEQWMADALDSSSVSRMTDLSGKSLRDAYWYTSDTRVKAAITQAAQTLANRMPTSIDGEMWRGMTVPDTTMTLDALAARFQPGADVDLNLTSFTSSKDVAKLYAKTKADTDHRVIMNLVDARGVALQPEPGWDEHLVSGKATVVRTEMNGDLMEVWLRYVG